MGTVGDLVGDLFSPMRGQAVHHDRIRLGLGDQTGVDLVGREDLLALLRLGLLAHAGPGIGIDDVRAAHGLVRVAQEAQPGAALGRHLPPERDGPLGEVVAFGRGLCEVDAQPAATEEQGYGDVVAVADKGQAAAAQVAEVLADRQKIGHGLARVAEVAQAVDDRHAGMAGELQDVVVREDAGHDRVAISGQDAAHIGDRFALAQADLVGREV